MIFFYTLYLVIIYVIIMKKSLNAFSLIEVIVATSILTIAVFWVFKLIWENSKILAQSQNYIQSNLLLQPSKECLDFLLKDNDLNYMKWLPVLFYLDLNSFSGICSIWNINTINTLDNIDYQIIINKSDEWDDYIDWEINVNTDTTNPIQINYKQK